MALYIYAKKLKQTSLYCQFPLKSFRLLLFINENEVATERELRRWVECCFSGPLQTLAALRINTVEINSIKTILYVVRYDYDHDNRSWCVYELWSSHIWNLLVFCHLCGHDFRCYHLKRRKVIIYLRFVLAMIGPW